MNNVEEILLKKRLENPVENFDRIVDFLATLVDQVASAQWAKDFDTRERLSVKFNETIDTMVRRLYVVGRRDPDAFERKTFDLGRIPAYGEQLVRRAGYAANAYRRSRPSGVRIESLLDNPTVVTADSVRSYDILRRFGFRIGRVSRVFGGTVYLILATKLLNPELLASVLNGGGSRVKKLEWLNDTLAAVGLPRVVIGTPEDNIRLRMVKLARNYRRKMQRYEALLKRCAEKSEKKRGKNEPGNGVN